MVTATSLKHTDRPSAVEPDQTRTDTASGTVRPAPDRFARALAAADIRIGGDRPWDMRINDPRALSAVRRRGMIGLGESYMNGWWDCDAIDQMFDRAVRAGAPALFRHHPRVILGWLGALLRNGQTRRASARDISAHYDLGYELFSKTLDRRMAYSCGYWRDAHTLDEAQEAKLELVCQKLGLEPGMRVLDIGCGWGSFVKYAVERHGVRAVGVTLSHDQAEHDRALCKGLDVEILLKDYRAITGRFDRIASIGMFEHVGPKNYRTFMDVARRSLADDGLFLLHTFATRDSFPSRIHSEVDWINRRIFPGLVTPSMAQIGRALDGRFVIEDVENFGADYDPTLMAWCANFDRAWPELSAHYDERFRRMWRYYLLQCAGAFRARGYQVWQLLLSKHGAPGGFVRPLPGAGSTAAC